MLCEEKKNYLHTTSDQLTLMFNPLRFMTQLKIKFRKFLLKENWAITSLYYLLNEL